jgi:hypothetical protein
MIYNLAAKIIMIDNDVDDDNNNNNNSVSLVITIKKSH